MITSEIVIAYTQCRRKAFLLLFSNNRGVIHEYTSVIEREAKRNKDKYINKLKDKVEQTKRYSPEEMKNGTPVLLEAKLEFDNLEASAVALIENNTPSSPRKHNYIPSIVVGTYKITLDNKLHLTFVAYVLSKLQTEKPLSGVIVRCGGKISTINLISFYNEISTALRHITNWKKMETPELPEIVLNKHCSCCCFKKECGKEAIEKDDLSLLSRISPKDINKYKKKGIFTINQLSYLFKPRKQRKGKKKAIIPLRYRPELQALAIRTQKIYLQELPELMEHKVELFLDIEGIPDQDAYYLIGLLVFNADKQLYYSFWADSIKDEERIWREFIVEVNKYPGSPIYHYGNYDSKAISKLKSRYGKESDLPIDRLINVNSYIYGKVYFPVKSNTLKELGQFLGMTWSHAESSGLQSLVWRYYWDETQDNKYKRILLSYNEEDCRALYSLKTKLSNITKTANIKKDIDFADQPKKHTTATGKLIHDELEQIIQSAHADYDNNKISTKTNNDTKIVSNKTNKQSYVRIVPKHNKVVQVPCKRKCVSCSGTLTPTEDSAEHVITDLVFSKNGCRKIILKYIGKISYCTKCNRKYLPKIIEDYQGRPFGHALIAWTIYQRIINRLPYRIITQTMDDMFNTGVAEGTIIGWMSYFAKYYAYTERLLIQKILKSNIIHADETKINIQGEDHFVWVFTDGEHVVFKITENREATVAHEFLSNYKGVLITDFYPGYDSIECRQQKCWVHLIRDINNDLWDEPFNEEFEAFVFELGKVIVSILQTIQKYGLKTCHTNKYKRSIDQFYKNNIDNSAYSFEVTIKYQKRLQRYKDSLFTFMEEDGVPWNNNMAERAIRQLAVQRKISGSFYKNRVSDYLLLLAISQTCRFQDKSFLKFLVSGEKNVDLFKKPQKQKYSTPHEKT